MKIAITLLFDFYALCYVGSAVISRTMKPSNEDITTVKNEIPNMFTETKNLTETNDDLTKSNINDTEIYENGQTAKKDHGRSFIYIKNMMSRLPWFKTHASLFQDDFGKARDVSDDVYDKIRSFKVKPQFPMHRFYFDNEFVRHSLPLRKNYNHSNVQNENDVNFAHNPYSISIDAKNQMAMKELLRSRERITFSLGTSFNYKNTPIAFQMKPPVHHIYNEAFNDPLKSMALKNQNYMNQMGYLNQGGIYNNIPLIAFPVSTSSAPMIEYDARNPEYKIYAPDNDEINRNDRLVKYIKNILRDDNVNNEKNFAFNCYNRDCLSRSINYHVNLNNGVRLGSKCMCLSSLLNPITLTARDTHPWKKSAIASEKAFIRAVKANEADPYTALIKETKELSKIVDRME